MFKNPSFLFDILCTVVWLVLMVRYARKGFLASIVQLSGNLISLLGARQLPPVRAGCLKICWPGASVPKSPPTFRRTAW